MSGAAAAQDPVEAFYKGKQIAMVVGSSVGGGYDTYARLLARTTLELVFSQGQFGRPYVMPQGVPEDRTAALRQAFVVALNDKALRAEAAKMQLDVDPLPREELQTLVASLYATPPHLVERARPALSPKTAAKP